MKKLTYQEAHDKIIEAYFKDEIKPFNSEFCFCGTLCGNRTSWSSKSQFRQWTHPYAWSEYGRMEVALFSTFPGIKWVNNGTANFAQSSDCLKNLVDYEDRLFAGMAAALEVLKQIHKERGEDVDSVPVFTKRVLQPVF